jgi:hypothetical protein
MVASDSFSCGMTFVLRRRVALAGEQLGRYRSKRGFHFRLSGFVNPEYS